LMPVTVGGGGPPCPPPPEVTGGVSDVVATVTVIGDAVAELVTPSSSTVTLWLAGIVWVLNSPQVATSPLRLQFPIEVPGVALLVSKMAEFPDERLVPDGKVIVIWLPATWDIAPVEETVNEVL